MWREESRARPQLVLPSFLPSSAHGHTCLPPSTPPPPPALRFSFHRFVCSEIHFRFFCSSCSGVSDDEDGPAPFVCGCCSGWATEGFKGRPGGGADRPGGGGRDIGRKGEGREVVELSDRQGERRRGGGGGGPKKDGGGGELGDLLTSSSHSDEFHFWILRSSSIATRCRVFVHLLWPWQVCLQLTAAVVTIWGLRYGWAVHSDPA